MKICFFQCGTPTLVGRIKKEFPQHVIVEIGKDENSRIQLSSADVLIVGRKPIIDSAIISDLKHCALIIRDGIGYDNIDIEFARKEKIKVYNISEYCVKDVEEHTIAMLLAYSRNLINYSKDLSTWGRPTYPIVRLSGMKLGIAGFGRIGRAVAGIAEAIGMRISYFDPYIPTTSQFLRFHSLGDLFQNNDIVSLHMPLNEETYGLINKETLEQASKVILINNARGKIVNYPDLYDAILNNHILAYLSDVMDNEPPVENCIFDAYCNPEDPIHDRLLLTPHIAFSSNGSLANLETDVIELLRTFNKPSCRFTPINT